MTDPAMRAPESFPALPWLERPGQDGERGTSMARGSLHLEGKARRLSGADQHLMRERHDQTQ
jgi:hypothetical protein